MIHPLGPGAFPLNENITCKKQVLKGGGGVGTVEFRSQRMEEDPKLSVKVAACRACWAKVKVMYCLEFKLCLNHNVQSQ